MSVLSINSTPMVITIKPIILDRALIPDAPKALMMYRELISNRKVTKHTAPMDPITENTSVRAVYS